MRTLGKCKRRLEGIIKIDLNEEGWESVKWIHLSQDRGQWLAVMNTVTYFLVL
jgi:hypothetical protein